MSARYCVLQVHFGMELIRRHKCTARFKVAMPAIIGIAPYCPRKENKGDMSG